MHLPHSISSWTIYCSPTCGVLLWCFWMTFWSSVDLGRPSDAHSNGSRNPAEATTFLQTNQVSFGSWKILYLGHVLTGHSTSPDPKKLQSVEEWPIPESVTQVRIFLGFANYFRRFIKHYADIAKPLDAITGKGARFSWNDERQQAFEDLKSALICAPVLPSPLGCF